MATIYMNIDGLPGDSTAKDFSKQFEILSFSFGASNSTSVGSGGSGAGKASLSPVTVTIRNYNLPLLLKYVTLGTRSAKAVFTFLTNTGAAAPAPYEVITLGNIVISSLDYSASGDAPLVSLSFLYQTITTTESGKNPAPTLPTYSYDIKTATGK